MKVRYTMKAYKTGKGVWQASMMRKGKRITIYLGKNIDEQEAHRSASILSRLLDSPSDTWKTDGEFGLLSDRVRASLQRHFDFDCPTDLEYLFDRHLASKSEVKEATRTRYRQYYKVLGKFFRGRALSTLTVEDGEGFRLWSLGQGGFSEATVSRGVRACKSIFKFGVDNGILSCNPFEKIRRGSDSNVGRMFYVDRRLFDRILSCCRDDCERLILALARYGGLRVPSEIRLLRFRDFTENVIRIDGATKTGARDVPFFTEIREIFVRLSGDSDELVFPDLKRGFPRQVLFRAIKSAGVKRWPKPFD